MKKNTATVKTTKATAKPTEALAFKCGCPYCDDEVTENKTPLFCTPCAPVAAAPVKKQARKAKSAAKTS